MFQVVHAFSGWIKACLPPRTHRSVLKSATEKPPKDFNLRFNTIWPRYTLHGIDCKEGFLSPWVHQCLPCPHYPELAEVMKGTVYVCQGIWTRLLTHCNSTRLEIPQMFKLETGWNELWNISQSTVLRNREEEGVCSAYNNAHRTPKLWSVWKARCRTVSMCKMLLCVCYSVLVCVYVQAAIHLNLERWYICCKYRAFLWRDT